MTDSTPSDSGATPRITAPLAAPIVSEGEAAPIPVPASTILMVRDGADGALEVFMVVRHHQIDFASGALVFPGGKVDAGDADEGLMARAAGCDDLDNAQKALRIGAIREAFEECGLLLARRRGQSDLIPAADLVGLSDRYRDPLHKGEISMAAFAEAEDLELACDLMVPFAHWITPPFMKKRFDTHFYIARTPPEQLAAHDGSESVDSVWISPATALADADAGRRTVIFPTRLNLQKLGQSSTVDAALEAARSAPVVTVLPEMRKTDAGRTMIIPVEAGYGGPEFAVADPSGG